MAQEREARLSPVSNVAHRLDQNVFMCKETSELQIGNGDGIATVVAGDKGALHLQWERCAPHNGRLTMATSSQNHVRRLRMESAIARKSASCRKLAKKDKRESDRRETTHPEVWRKSRVRHGAELAKELVPFFDRGSFLRWGNASKSL